MKKEKTVDMTRGPVLKQMAVFALPVLLGMLCQRIYNFADAYIVGRFLGDGALAAVSIAGTAMYMMTSVMMGVTTGVGIVVSQFYGGGQQEKIRETFAAGIHVSVWMTVIITAVGMATTAPLLRLLQTSSELMPDAYDYLLIIYAGCGATMLYNFASAVLRAMGNSVVPLIFLIVSSILNVILDVAFVAWIPMGVAGAAIATVLSQLISGVLCVAYALKIMPVLRPGQKGVEAGSVSDRTDPAVRTSDRAADEYHFHLGHDASGSYQYVQHSAHRGIWRGTQSGGSWLSDRGCDRDGDGDLCRTERGSRRPGKSKEGSAQRISPEPDLLRRFLSGSVFPGGSHHAGVHG